MQYRATKTAHGVVCGCIYLRKIILYRQYYYNLDFILPWLYPDVAKSFCGCSYDYIGTLDNSSRKVFYSVCRINSGSWMDQLLNMIGHMGKFFQDLCGIITESTRIIKGSKCNHIKSHFCKADTSVIHDPLNFSFFVN